MIELALTVALVCVMFAVLLAIAWRLDQPNQEQLIRQDVQLAASQVEAVINETRIRMDEAVGIRQINEPRLGDDLGGNWRRW